MSDPDNERESIGEPLQLNRIFMEKIWGGRVLEETPGIEIEVEGPVGETWELVDREDHVSVIRGGGFAERSLRGLMMSSPEAILGKTSPSESGHFPVMVKYLCATKPLSVQVHPDNKAAERLGFKGEGKHECWYVLAAEPDSLIYLGLKEGVDASEFVDVADTSGVVDHLQHFEVKTGDFIDVPAGTLHSIGEGITLVEVQDNADVTFRLYDWDRSGLNGEPRELHKEQALVSVDWDARPVGPTRPEFQSCGGGNHCAQLIEAERFSVSLYDLASYQEFDACERAAAYVLIEGRARIAAGEERWSMEGGDTWLVPASFGSHRVMPEGEQAKLLRVETRG